MYMKKKGLYFRYADDILLILDQKQAWEVLQQMKGYLSKYKLELNEAKTEILKPYENFEYLGYFFKDNGVSIRQKSIDKFKIKVKQILNKNKYDKLKFKTFDPALFLELLQEINTLIDLNSENCWLRHFLFIDDVGVLERLDTWLIEEVQHKLTGKRGRKNYSKVPIRILKNPNRNKAFGLKSLLNQYWLYRKNFAKQNFHKFVGLSYMQKQANKYLKRIYSQEFEDFKNHEKNELSKLQQ